MTKEEKPKTRWGCLIAAIIVFLVLGGSGYIFYAYVYPIITQKGKTQSTYNPPQLDKTGKEKVKDTKSYGEPIKDSEAVGRTDPFAPI